MSQPDVVVLTGMSGAGRSTAANALEDLGWFVVDNMPPALLPTLVELAGRGGDSVPRIAAVLDARGGGYFTALLGALDEVAAQGSPPRVVFLEADDASLVKRFESSRRPHPLQGEGRLVEGIERERLLLGELRARADLLVDTSDLNVHQLRARIEQAFEGVESLPLRVTVVSFGYKYGVPPDADMVGDCRFLPNPHWIPDLREHTGRDALVSDYVLGQPGAADFLEHFGAALRIVLAGYAREGKRYATVGLGCTGGKHRSVAMAEALAALLADSDARVRVVHRDLGRE
ncbi:MAG: RNase adapter RapZ [Actinomycetota bacterium]|nr:RNase adapter RapZ [Actinomycetota bacterium]MDH5277820.1 RNase adapter RapZ [Actinomycetota bacterium]